MFRYYLTSFKRGQWPVEFQMCPPEDSFKCCKCRGEKKPRRQEQPLAQEQSREQGVEQPRVGGMLEMFHDHGMDFDLSDEEIENDDDDER